MSHSKRIDIFLQPGEYFVGDQNCRIRTLLGSCVSITLLHAERKVGAMSPCLLPSRLHAPDQEIHTRSGEAAMTLLLH